MAEESISEVGESAHMTRSHRKRRHFNHVSGDDAVDVVIRKLPNYWVVRKLSPDYGLDLHVEVFDLLPDGSGSVDALGEHFYAQVKGVHGLALQSKFVHAQRNVAKNKPGDFLGEELAIEVVAYSLDVNELLTIEAMGAAVPTVLFVVDLDSDIVYYVCLNDHITKVLLPQQPNYEVHKTVTVHLPALNILDKDKPDFSYFWLLARRAKYYAGFNQFNYQKNELDYLAPLSPDESTGDWTDNLLYDRSALAIIGVFLRANARLDIWDAAGPGQWFPLEVLRRDFEGLETVLERLGTPQPHGSIEANFSQIEQVFARAAGLGRMYEELVREWRLSTHLATILNGPAVSG